MMKMYSLIVLAFSICFYSLDAQVLSVAPCTDFNVLSKRQAEIDTTCMDIRGAIVEKQKDITLSGDKRGSKLRPRLVV